MKAIPTAPGCWTERYESLRRHFLEQPCRFEATPLGLVMLMGNGVAGWIHRWTDSSPPPEGSASGPRPKSYSLPPNTGVQLQVSLLLAQMTVVHLLPSSPVSQ